MKGMDEDGNMVEESDLNIETTRRRNEAVLDDDAASPKSISFAHRYWRIFDEK